MTPPTDPADVKGPPALAHLRGRLLDLAADGITTEAAADALDLGTSLALRCLTALRAAGDVRLERAENGVEWRTNENQRSA
ncbi:hypothetical protein [Nonomuraea bangladeshensis]|uniref:hypothetical protein n=1 Tax=Nonomuraea bangladeshensis TaxID=404385 RepID=UPI003C2F5DA1